ncbi:SET domain-containing protein [Mollisia scopiformis]|uniref:SET domain-containing protein n=1 Tax=Mollisia scopiformis TaxID=149040 RepID=A0A132B8Q3_MOLSC|nr:SET domain-containing protein [Mollisia scopiformis]KUJ08751.1 SET domain-containing protein [Mollisia scopiformis]
MDLSIKMGTTWLWSLMHSFHLVIHVLHYHLVMLSSALFSLALCSVVQAGSFDLTTPRIELDDRLQLEQFLNAEQATCPIRDNFSIQVTEHLHPGICAHDNHHPTQNTSSVQTADPISPWTIYPTCTTNTTKKFCVFTSQTFHANRGITILTTPSTARVLSRLPAFHTKTPHLSPLSENDHRDPPFVVSAIPGRGMGLIANRTIERGDLIKSHPAIAIFHNDAVTKGHALYPTHYAPLMHLAINQLPPPTRSLFLAMAAHNVTEEPYIERIYTNTFGEDFNNQEHSIVIPETARLNHDCRPNAMYYFDPRTLVHYTHAARRIYAGEEITITYVDPLQTRLKRRAAIKRSWGFECSCSLCSQGVQFVRESNRRIVRINELMKMFGDLDLKVEGKGKKGAKVGGSPEIAELLVGLFEQERLYASIVDAYRVAALAYAAKGMEWRAVMWAMRAVEAGLIHDGPRGAGVLDMKRLLTAPREHWSWGVKL